MEEGLRGLKGMFDALLNVSRLDAKLIEPARAPVWIAEIMDRVSVGSKVEAEQNGLRFSEPERRTGFWKPTRPCSRRSSAIWFRTR